MIESVEYTGTVTCQNEGCGKEHVAELSHLSPHGGHKVYAVVCTDWLTDYYTEEVVTLPETIRARDLQADSATMDRNRSRHTVSAIDECFLCGRGLTEKARDNGWSIHLHVDGTLIPNGQDVGDEHGSQGWFPVGSECAKRIPKTHRAKG